MLPNDKISLAEWWKYELATIATAWKSTDKKASAFWSVMGAAMTALLLFKEGSKSESETWIAIVNIIGVSTVIFLAQFFINLLRAPAKMAKESKISEGVKNSEIERLSGELKERKKMAVVPRLLGRRVKTNGEDSIDYALVVQNDGNEAIHDFELIFHIPEGHRSPVYDNTTRQPAERFKLKVIHPTQKFEWTAYLVIRALVQFDIEWGWTPEHGEREKRTGIIMFESP